MRDISGSPIALVDADDHVGATASPAATNTVPRAALRWSPLAARVLGAVAVLAVGVIHLDAYRGPYSAVPTIGALFAVNFVTATTIGIALLLPIERLAGRWSGIAVTVITFAGITLAGGSLVMLIISQHGTVFGFHEPGYDPEAISRSRIAELLAVGLLTGSLGLRLLVKATPRW
jgi:hypothetical protein